MFYTLESVHIIETIWLMPFSLRKDLYFYFFCMIDIKILRNNPEIVAKALHDKVIAVDLDRVIELDKKRIFLQQELDELRAKRNEISSKMGK